MVAVEIYASAIGISAESQCIAERSLATFEHGRNVTGKDPRGFIAAAIYLASKQTGENKPKKHVAIACGITEVTLRSRIKDFQDYLPRRG
nr:hypothetical protein [Candidatus Sigynarchaeum springense]MDO8115928.1 hypothetical protein [Candidatus Sigynarchaeota archaeon]